MAVIGILATLTFTLGESIRERGKNAQARVELAILATALESFKSRYGDYPQTLTFSPAGANTTVALGYDNAESRFFNALAGVFDPEMNPFTNADDGEVFGKTFIEGARFTFENHDGDGAALFPETPGTDVTNAFLDPWGRRYQYFYKNSGGWTHPGFVLYSVGSDGAHEAPPTGGFPDYDDPANIDNLYAGRN